MAWSLGNSIGSIMLLVVKVLGSEVVFLEMVDPVGHLYLKVLKSCEPDEHGVVGTQVELFVI
jgi:hypothetical protein